MERICSQSDVDEGLAQLLVQCPSLVPLSNEVGQLPLRLRKPGFEGLVRIIVGQQVSTASATAIHTRLVKTIGPLSPEAFLSAGEPAWIAAGLSRAKQASIANLAMELAKGSLDLAQLAQMPADEAIAALTALRGIGPWTADVYLLFCAGHCDIFPAGDLALQEAIRAALALKARPDEGKVREIAAEWSPWRGIAARLFWAYYRLIREGREALPV